MHWSDLRCMSWYHFTFQSKLMCKNDDWWIIFFLHSGNATFWSQGGSTLVMYINMTSLNLLTLHLSINACINIPLTCSVTMWNLSGYMTKNVTTQSLPHFVTCPFRKDVWKTDVFSVRGSIYGSPYPQKSKWIMTGIISTQLELKQFRGLVWSSMILKPEVHHSMRGGT